MSFVEAIYVAQVSSDVGARPGLACGCRSVASAETTAELIGETQEKQHWHSLANRTLLISTSIHSSRKRSTVQSWWCKQWFCSSHSPTVPARFQLSVRAKLKPRLMSIEMLLLIFKFGLRTLLLSYITCAPLCCFRQATRLI